MSDHLKLAKDAAKRMKTSSRKRQTVKTWAKHMRAIVGSAK